MPFTLQITAVSVLFVTAAAKSCEFPSSTAALAGATVTVTVLGVGGGSGGGPEEPVGTLEPTAAQPTTYPAITPRMQSDSVVPCEGAKRIEDWSKRLGRNQLQ